MGLAFPLLPAAGPSSGMTALAAGPAQPSGQALASPIAFFPLSGAPRCPARSACLASRLRLLSPAGSEQCLSCIGR